MENIIEKRSLFFAYYEDKYGDAHITMGIFSTRKLAEKRSKNWFKNFCSIVPTYEIEQQGYSLTIIECILDEITESALKKLEWQKQQKQIDCEKSDTIKRY